MTPREGIGDALATLWRQKLRSSLTIGGVVVGIAALVALLMFAAGMNKNVQDQVEKFRLLQTMTVTPGGSNGDTAGVLDPAALAWMGILPGVLQAYPHSPFPVNVAVFGDTITSEAQAIPPHSRGSLLFEHLLAGEVFGKDEPDRAVVTSRLLSDLKLHDPDSLLGQQLVLYSIRSDPDSGFAAVRDTLLGNPQALLAMAPELLNLSSRDSTAGHLFGMALASFLHGYMTRVDTVRDTVTVTGIVDSGEGWGERLRPVVLPETTAKHLDPGVYGANPLTLVQTLQSGDFFERKPENAGESYTRVTLELGLQADHAALRDSLKTRGYQVSDFLEVYTEFRKMMLLFTAGMTLLGIIALFIAALGIANTMVMSILERRREIGVLKALGADDRDIRILFLVESGTIGLIGSVLGLFVGWGASEIAGLLMLEFMKRQGVEQFDLFHLSLEIALIAILFGIVVSTLAGLYPALRAARLDPVVALREE